MLNKEKVYTMKQRFLWLFVGIIALLFPLFSSAQSTTAEAIQQANVRATTDVSAEKVGEITVGTAYPVIGKSEFYPWVLIADPVTLIPIGWVFQDLVTLRGSLATVPVSSLVVTANMQPTPTLPAVPLAPQTTAQQSLPTPTLIAPTQAFNVAGLVLGEVNVRYGPAVTYPRLGVALAGERFQITGYHTQYPWIQVAYSASPNGYAWILKDLLEIQGNLFSLPAISDGVLLLPTLTPTPSVLSSSNLLSQQTVPLRPEFVALGEEIWGLMLNARFDPATSRFGSLFLMDLQTGEAITFANEIAYSGTSVSKIEILARLYASLDTPPDGRVATDIANTMICSENMATNRLLNVIGQGDEFRGAEETTRFLEALGMKNSYLASPFIADPNKIPTPTRPLYIPAVTSIQNKANPDFSNQVTVDEVGWLLASIYQCAYQNTGAILDQFSSTIEPRECRQMLHVMSNNNVDALLRAGVPAEVRVAHKHGWIEDTHSNAGVFFTEGGDYVMVMFMHQPGFLAYPESLPVMAEASRRVYNFYNPTTPLAAIRDGYIPEASTCNFANTPLVTELRQPIWDN